MHAPYSVGLVIAGIGLAVLPWHPLVGLSRDLVYTGILPPLIFEAAYELRREALRRDLALVVLLATVGVALSALAAGTVMTSLAHWPLSTSLVFGILMSATDPASVLATLKEIGARGRLAVLIEAESLLNDGTAAAFFALTIGFLAGAVVASVALAIIGRTDDHLIEVALTAVAAYGSFLSAEQYHGSGILAALTAGMLLGNPGPRWGFFSEAGDRAVRSTWEFITFLANSAIFLLIGIAEGHENLSGLWVTAGAAILAVLVGRAAAVYPVCAIFARGRYRAVGTQQHTLVWGRLRGALGLALVLSIPETLPLRHSVVAATFAVVAF